ncbi:MAG: electron transfer flavoprotein subunit beta [Candidatus Izemoplasmatales bacterium]
MKIVVCMKQVPNTKEVRIDPQTGVMIREGVQSIINPDDLSGLEAALKLKDEIGAEVIALTMGPLQAESALREAIAMGVDEAVLLTDRLFAGSDTWATSLALAKAIEKIAPDLIIAGRQAIDGDTAQVGPQIAEHLGIPSVAYVSEINYGNDVFQVKRMFEDGYYICEVKTPCLFTVLKEINEPRYMRVGNIYSAFASDKIKTMTAADLDIKDEDLGLKGSPTKVKKSFTKGAKTAGKVFDVDANEAAKVIVDKLKELYIL